MFQEPSGTPTRTDMVCVVTSGSQLRTGLTVQPEWIDGTALGKKLNLNLHCAIHESMKH